MIKYNLLKNKINYVCEYEYNYFLNKKNVIGLGLGYKIKCGFCINQLCIKVFVVNKVDIKKIKNNDLVPTYYKGILTDVIETDMPRAYSFTERIRPVPGGYNISTGKKLPGGTMGCLVTDGNYDYILGNYHTLTNLGKTFLGAHIIQPGRMYGGQESKDTIGILYNYIPFKYIKGTYRPENYVDCALAKAIYADYVSPQIALIGFINGTDVARLASQVRKVGSTTELTLGKVMAINATRIVEFPENKKCLFKNQICTTGMAEGGDSGAILLNNNKKALGLLLGGSSGETIYNDINRVLSSLKVKIVIR